MTDQGPAQAAQGNAAPTLQSCNLADAARMLRKGAGTIRTWIRASEALSEADRQADARYFAAHEVLRTPIKHGVGVEYRISLVALDRVRRARRCPFWHPELATPFDPIALVDEVATLRAEIARLRAQEGRQSVSSMPPHTDSPPSRTDALSAPVRAQTPTRPLQAAAWAREPGSQRSDPLYTAMWRLDAEQAHKGYLQWHTWGKLCGVSRRTIDTHRRRDSEGRLPAQLGFHRIEKHGMPHRYVDAAQRAAWAGYWQSLGHIESDGIPSDSVVADALQHIASWANVDADEHAEDAEDASTPTPTIAETRLPASITS